MSKVSVSAGVPGFGLDHTGEFRAEKPGPWSSDNKYNNSYEVGCPVRGRWDYTEKRCEVNGSERVYVGVGCWSDEGFEADAGYCDMETDEAKCLCVAKTTANGVPDSRGGGQVFVSGVVDELGKEFHTGEYNVEPNAGCRHCEALTCDENACGKCNNCEYKHVRVENQEKPVGICVDKKEKQEGADEGDKNEGPGIFDFDTLQTVPGQGSKQSKRLRILPHYRHPKIRDVDKQPFNAANPQGVGGPEYLSRGQWQKSYKELAPFLQAHLDDFRRALGSSLEKPLDALRCQEPAPTGEALQGTLVQLEDLAKKVQSFTRMQWECRGMQAVKGKIAPDLGFALAGAPTVGGEPLQCKKSKEGLADAGCTQLNCYVADVEVRPTLEKMLTKLDACLSFYRTKAGTAGQNIALGAPTNAPPAASAVGLGGVLLLVFADLPLDLGPHSTSRGSSSMGRGSSGLPGRTKPEEQEIACTTPAARHRGFL